MPDKPIPLRPAPTVTPAAGTRAQIFAEVLTSGPTSRTDLSRRLGLSQSTVTRAVTPLLDMGYLVEAGAHSSGTGRPRRILRVARDRHVVLGVKFAPHHVTVVLTDLQAVVLDRRHRPMTAGYGPPEAVAAARSAVHALLAAHPAAQERLLGVGVAIGGHVDAGAGRCVRGGVLGWGQTDIAGTLSATLSLPVVVNNDANALLVAERWFGAGRASDPLAVVTVGAGVGCGLLLGGSLFTGATGLAGELGHVPTQPGGPRCSCGNRGCLEAVTSEQAILEAISRTSSSPCRTMEDAVARARGGDGPALRAFAEMGEVLGRGLATVCNLFNPQRIVLTGEGVVAHEFFGASCRAALAAHGFSSAARDCELVVHVADEDQWARGAACLAIREAVLSFQ